MHCVCVYSDIISRATLWAFPRCCLWSDVVGFLLKILSAATRNVKIPNKYSSYLKITILLAQSHMGIVVEKNGQWSSIRETGGDKSLRFVYVIFARAIKNIIAIQVKSWHISPWARYLSLIASLHSGVQHCVPPIAGDEWLRVGPALLVQGSRNILIIV